MAEPKPITKQFQGGHVTIHLPRNIEKAEVLPHFSTLVAKLVEFLSQTSLRSSLEFLSYGTTKEPTTTKEGLKIRREVARGLDILVDVGSERIGGILQPTANRSVDRPLMITQVRSHLHEKEAAPAIVTETGDVRVRSVSKSSSPSSFTPREEPKTQAMSEPVYLPEKKEKEPRAAKTLSAARRFMADPIKRSLFLTEVNEKLESDHAIRAGALAAIGRKHFEIPASCHSSVWSEKVNELVSGGWFQITGGERSGRRYAFTKAAVTALTEAPKILREVAPEVQNEPEASTAVPTADTPYPPLEVERVLEPLPPKVLLFEPKHEEDDLMALLPPGLKVFGRFMDAWAKAREAQKDMQHKKNEYEDAKKTYENAKRELEAAISETHSRAT